MAELPRPNDVRIVVSTEPEAVVVTVVGELDMSSSPALRAEISEQLRRRPTAMIVNLESVTFCASAGLQVLAEAATETFVREVPLVIATARPAVVRALEIGRLIEVVPLTTTVQQGRAWIRGQR